MVPVEQIDDERRHAHLFHGKTQSPQHFSKPSRFFSASRIAALIRSIPASIASNCSDREWRNALTSFARCTSHPTDLLVRPAWPMCEFPPLCSTNDENRRMRADFRRRNERTSSHRPSIRRVDSSDWREITLRTGEEFVFSRPCPLAR